MGDLCHESKPVLLRACRRGARVPKLGVRHSGTGDRRRRQARLLLRVALHPRDLRHARSLHGHGAYQLSGDLSAELGDLPAPALGRGTARRRRAAHRRQRRALAGDLSARTAARQELAHQRLRCAADRGQDHLRFARAMSFLAIDIGNTRLKWALYSAPQPGAGLLGHGAIFLEAIDALAERDWKGLPAPASMLGCVVAGEGIRRRAEAQLEIWDIEPRWVVSSASACGVTNGYDHPNRLGVDRWVALIGARQRILAL